MSIPRICVMGPEEGHTATTLRICFREMDYKLVDVISKAEFIFLSLDIKDSSELHRVFFAADVIRKRKSENAILCITSQVPVGTTEQLAKIAGCDTVYIPEFLRVEDAINSFKYADRVVIGHENSEIADRVALLYEPLGCPILFMDIRSAELVKHTCNAFLATSISFINEISDLCTLAGADISKVIHATKFDKRIGHRAYLDPGRGFTNGHLEREVRTLQDLGHKYNYKTLLADAVMAVNENRKCTS